MVGSALMRRLKALGYEDVTVYPRKTVDLTIQDDANYVMDHSFEYVFICAGRVGGIMENMTHQADFLYDNLMIAANVIHGAAMSDTVKRVIYLGSSCIYPRQAACPIREDQLLSGALEPTNEGYAIAKIAGIKLCEMYRRQYAKDFVSVIPTNLYGPNDNFDPESSHVLPGLLRKITDAKAKGDASVTLWGTGFPLREFLYVDDLADALVFLMNQPDLNDGPYNIGSGEGHTIRFLAEIIACIVGYKGEFKWDTSRPDGVYRKDIDSRKLAAMGWAPKTSLHSGIQATYQWLNSGHRLSN